MHEKTPNFMGTAAAVAIAYWIVGALCRGLVNADTQTVPVWLAAGVVFGALQVVSASRRTAVLAGALVASYVWGLTAHRLNAAAGVPFALIEVASAAAGAWVARQAARGTANGLGEAAWLIGGALLTAALGATLAAEFWRWQRPGAVYGAEWRAWAFSTAVGVLLAAPVIAAFRGFQVKRSGGMSMAQFGAGAVAFAVFLAVAGIVFGTGVQQRFGTVAATLGYLPMPFLLLSAMVWGPRGGALAMLVGALFIIGLTAIGGGPFAVADSFAGEAVIEVQAYVAVWAALVLLARGLSESQREAKARARDWQLRYERILGAAGVASVEFDAVTGAAVWDAHAAAVLGTEVFALQHAADWHARIDAPDRALSEAAWNAVARGQQPESTGVYTVRLASRVLAVQAQFAAVRGPDGAVERVAGLLRPVASAHGEEGAVRGSHHG